MSNDEVIFRGYGLSLRIPEHTLEVWRGFRQVKANELERFGAIIGSRTEGSEEYWIDRVTQPFSSDRATRSSFLLQDKKHQSAVDTAFEQSGGTLVYLGTWHTHPESIPSSSIIDKKDWVACIRRNPGTRLFFVIVGLDEVRVFVRRVWGLGFGRLKKDC